MNWLRDPIVLFVLLGAALAALHLGFREDPVRIVRDTRIVVTDADVAFLGQVFEQTWNRSPTADELRSLVDRRVRDELLFREAVALGLDEGDATLRRRIGMKLEFLVKDAGSAMEPTDADFQAHLDAHPERYAVAPRRRFTHVYVSVDRRGGDADGYARSLLERLRAEADVDLDSVGDSMLIERDQPSSTPSDVERLFGQAFADALFAVDGDGWHGPLTSGYGLHLVRIDERFDGGAAPLELVRDRVRVDLIEVRRDTALEAYVEALREKYDVEMRTTLLEDPGE